MKSRYTLERKLAVQIRYFEEIWVIRDETGERIFVGGNEERAKSIRTRLERERPRHKKKRVYRPARKR